MKEMPVVQALPLPLAWILYPRVFSSRAHLAGTAIFAVQELKTVGPAAQACQRCFREAGNLKCPVVSREMGLGPVL